MSEAGASEADVAALRPGAAEDALASPGPSAAAPPTRAASDPAAPEVSEPRHGPVVYRAGMTLDEAERATILAALESASGNRRIAAESLGIGERTLYRKIDKLGLEA